MNIIPQGLVPTSLYVDAGTAGGITTAEGVCSDALGINVEGVSSNGVIMCPEDMIAVGGGGECDGSGRLFRSRPSPDGDGTTPRGWAAACTGGGSPNIHAICVWEDMNFNFQQCRTERKDGVGNITVSCPSNRTAVSAGGFCGNNRPLFSLNLNPALTQATVGCQGSSSETHAYVVCCE